MLSLSRGQDGILEEQIPRVPGGSPGIKGGEQSPEWSVPLPSPSEPTSTSTPTRAPHRLFSLDRRPSPPFTPSSSFMSNSSLGPWLWLALLIPRSQGTPNSLLHCLPFGIVIL